MDAEISIIVPVYNEEANIGPLCDRLADALRGMGRSFEVVFVNDGSTDCTLELLRRRREQNPSLRILSLSRRFGHAAALAAGMDAVVGRAVVLMDGDLQDAPEVIPQFVRQWAEGAEVVYALRASRREPAAARALFRGFHRLMAGLSGIPIPRDAGAFSLMDRCVVDVIRRMPERHRYLPGLRAFAGFRSVGVPVDRAARADGRSRVGWRGLLRLAGDGIFSFSLLPLRLVTVLGLVSALVALGVLATVLYKKWVTGEAITGWASTMTAILFMGAVQLITLGIVGEYVGRIYEESKRRPLYVVSERVGFDGDASSPDDAT
jgi:dolichol-phosphate mannosyltransferase